MKAECANAWQLCRLREESSEEDLSPEKAYIQLGGRVTENRPRLTLEKIIGRLKNLCSLRLDMAVRRPL